MAILQETHSILETNRAQTKSLGKNTGSFSNYTSQARGCCILINENEDTKIIAKRGQSNGRLCSLIVKFKTSKIGFCSIYAPNVRQDQNSRENYKLFWKHWMQS